RDYTPNVYTDVLHISYSPMHVSAWTTTRIRTRSSFALTCRKTQSERSSGACYSSEPAWLQLRKYSGKTPEVISTWIKPRSSKLEHHLVDVTPTPVFSGLKRLDNWVVSRVKVFGGMLVLGRIAAANMPAFETEAQVYPRISGF